MIIEKIIQIDICTWQAVDTSTLFEGEIHGADQR